MDLMKQRNTLKIISFLFDAVSNFQKRDNWERNTSMIHTSAYFDGSKSKVKRGASEDIVIESKRNS